MTGTLWMHGLRVYATEDHVLHIQWVSDAAPVMEKCFIDGLGPETVRLCIHVEGHPKPCDLNSGAVAVLGEIAVPRTELLA